MKDNSQSLKKAFDAISKTGGNMRVPHMSIDQLFADLEKRRVLVDKVVRPSPSVKGTTLPEVHSNLSRQDVKGAFVTCQVHCWEHCTFAQPSVDQSFCGWLATRFHHTQCRAGRWKDLP